jgi:UDP-2,3-diacylglucosamine hydrolase
MTRVFFISDAHLGLESIEKEKEKERKLVGFLRHVQQHGTHLFIVGDLFDAWFEYRTVIPKGFHRLLTSLEDLTQQGIETHYLAGNHDYWMGNYFWEYLGVHIHFEPFSMTLDGKRFYLHHGDGLMKNDAGYRILKKILRNPFNIWLYSLLHPDIGIGLARLSSRKSRHYTTQKNFGRGDDMLEFAAKKIENGSDYVIMGHRHQPVAASIGKGMYVNLGDWISSFTYAEFSSGRLELKTWKQNDTPQRINDNVR